MRTTIEITPAHRAQLRALAARRGITGVSGLVAEAPCPLDTRAPHRRSQPSPGPRT